MVDVSLNDLGSTTSDRATFEGVSRTRLWAPLEGSRRRYMRRNKKKRYGRSGQTDYRSNSLLSSKPLSKYGLASPSLAQLDIGSA